MNRLAGSTSPYLLQHADNPVHWEPWGEAALARARRESKPVFLSVGYSACHWCHVMAHECFENEAIARLLNESFVNVKVDREERPGTDDKVLVAWNGLAIDALAGAGAVLGEPRYVAAAIPAADFLLAECRDSAGRLANQWRRGQAGGLAFADDLACLVEGLVSLYEATFDERWITSAMELADRLVGESDHGSRADGGFLDPESGGFSRPQRSTSG